jgi:hypothetical protein
MNSADTITITIPDYDEYRPDDSSVIDLNGLTSSMIYTTDNTGGVSPGYGAVPSPGTITIGSTSGPYTFSNPTWSGPNESSIKLGEDFSIVASPDNSAKMIYKGQELEIGQLFGMFNAFKTLLKSVAEDSEFCAKHPEIRDMAYGYLIEELKR